MLFNNFIRQWYYHENDTIDGSYDVLMCIYCWCQLKKERSSYLECHIFFYTKVTYWDCTILNNNVNSFISSRLSNILGLKALGAIGVSGGGGNKNSSLDDWLDEKKKVLECADNRLPISFFSGDNEGKSSSGLAKRDNPYVESITQILPAEIIFRFTTTASLRVQDAIKSTILSLIWARKQGR